MKHYRSLYPNHVHLMQVVASSHLYLLADGRIKYQDKKIENKLATVHESKREVLVHMVIADHTSGAIYGETVSCRDTLDPVGFLQRAWKKKAHTFFGGLPEILCVSRTVEELWPEVVPFAEGHKVAVVNPTSGFQGGVIYAKLWETEIRSWGIFGKQSECESLASVSHFCQTQCNASFPERERKWSMAVPSRPAVRYLS